LELGEKLGALEQVQVGFAMVIQGDGFELHAFIEGRLRKTMFDVAGVLSGIRSVESSKNLEKCWFC